MDVIRSRAHHASRSSDVLSVPGPRLHPTSPPSESNVATNTFVASSQGQTLTENRGHNGSVNDKDALCPDPGTEADFEVEKNPFAFSPGQLGKLLNPKSLSAFHALGGLDGLEKGLRTDRRSGLSVEEQFLSGSIAFEEAVSQAPHNAERTRRNDHGTGLRGPDLDMPPASSTGTSFADRKRVFSNNRLPTRKSPSIWRFALGAYNDTVDLRLVCVGLLSIAWGLSQSSSMPASKGYVVGGALILGGVLLLAGVDAINAWLREGHAQNRTRERKLKEPLVKVIRSGKTLLVPVGDIYAGDILRLGPGEIAFADGVLVDGHGLKCDESSATGESDLLKKTAATEVQRAIETHNSLKKLDPFIISGSKVVEGSGTFMVTSTGVYSMYGKTMMSLREYDEPTPLQSALADLAGYLSIFGRLLVMYAVVRATTFLSSSFSNIAVGIERVAHTAHDQIVLAYALVRQVPMESSATGLAFVVCVVSLSVVRIWPRILAPVPQTNSSTSDETKAMRGRIQSFMRRRSGSPFDSIPGPLIYSLLIPSAVAQNADAAPEDNWRQRAVEIISKILVTCSFLLGPSLILLGFGVLAFALLLGRKQGTSALIMLLVAAVFITIRTPTGAETTDAERFVQLAVGIAYMFFMLVYCRLVMVLDERHKRGKGFCSIAIGLGVLITIVAMASAAIRAYWVAFTKLDPVFALSLTIPLSFALCDLAEYIANRVNGSVHDTSTTLPPPIPGPSPREPAGSSDLGHSFHMMGLRNGSGSLFHRTAYDADPEDIEFDDMQSAGPADEEAANQQPNNPSANRFAAWFERLLGKCKEY